MSKEDKKENKVKIDYLQFLSKPIESGEGTWFFTYLMPGVETIQRFEHSVQQIVYKKYQQVKKDIIKYSKKNKAVTTQTPVVKEEKKIETKIKTKTTNKLTREQLLNTAIELKIQGSTRQEIQLKLIQDFLISESYAGSIVFDMYKALSKEVDDDIIRFTVSTHSQLYDILYKKFTELSSYKMALRALKTKESLNGIGQDIFEVQVNNVFEDIGDLVSYGISKLNHSEQQELKRILSKIQRVNDDNNEQKAIKASK